MITDKNPGRTSLDTLGEFGLIAHLTENITIQKKSTITGIGDDAAVVSIRDKYMVITTDMLVEGVHFDLGYVPLKHLGYKAVVVNLSDVYAMNATATQITVSVAVSNRFSLEALEELYAGIKLAASLYQVDVIGGDTTSSNKGLVISVTAVGEVGENEVVYRSGAKPNDLLVVTGDLGGAYIGLKVLQREQEVYKVNPRHQPDLENYTYAIERQLKPEARKDMVELLKKLNVKPSAMIDISDGLSSEILHLCKASGTGGILYEEKIPLDPQVIAACEEFHLDSTTVALSGGEEYELLFTVAQDDYPKIKGNPDLTVIGYITEEKEGIHLVTRAGEQLPLQARGWNALRDREA